MASSAIVAITLVDYGTNRVFYVRDELSSVAALISKARQAGTLLELRSGILKSQVQRHWYLNPNAVISVTEIADGPFPITEFLGASEADTGDSLPWRPAN
jgi:hypothetical protein